MIASDTALPFSRAHPRGDTRPVRRGCVLMPGAYVIRRLDQCCFVVKLRDDNREEVVQDGMVVDVADIFCAMKIDDFSRPAATCDDS